MRSLNHKAAKTPRKNGIAAMEVKQKSVRGDSRLETAPTACEAGNPFPEPVRGFDFLQRY